MAKNRKNAPEVTAIIAGEPVTVRAGDTVEIRWAGYGGVRGSVATHHEGAADRDSRGRFVAAVTPDHVDRDGAHRGPALLLVGQHEVKPTNVLAAVDHEGEVWGRWLPLYRADGSPSSQVVAVTPAD